MLDLTFQELARVVGKDQAYEALLIIERSAARNDDTLNNRNTQIIPLDCESRLQGAFGHMRRSNYAALRHAPCMASETPTRNNRWARDFSPQPAL